MEKTKKVKLTKARFVAGAVVDKGKVVEMPIRDADYFINRGFGVEETSKTATKEK